jgi:hypothetical protein
MLRQTSCAHHKQRFLRISSKNLAAAIAVKPLDPFIAAIRHFEIFLHRPRDRHIFSTHQRHRAEWCATECLAIGTVTCHYLVR